MASRTAAPGALTCHERGKGKGDTMMMVTTMTDRQRAAVQGAEARLRAAQRAEAARILQAVAHAYNFTPAQLRSPSRPAELAEARQVAMFLMRTEARATVEEIGRALDRHHSTVLHGVAVIAARQERDRPLRWTVDAIRAELDREAI